MSDRPQFVDGLWTFKRGAVLIKWSLQKH